MHPAMTGRLLRNDVDVLQVELLMLIACPIITIGICEFYVVKIDSCIPPTLNFLHSVFFVYCVLYSFVWSLEFGVWIL